MGPELLIDRLKAIREPEMRVAALVAALSDGDPGSVASTSACPLFESNEMWTPMPTTSPVRSLFISASSRAVRRRFHLFIFGSSRSSIPAVAAR